MSDVAVLRLAGIPGLPSRFAAPETGNKGAGTGSSNNATAAAPPSSAAPAAPVSQDTPDVRLVFVEYHDYVWRTLLYLGVPRSSVDDATQDVFLVVHRRIADFDSQRPVRSWLYGIVRRVASGYRRAGRNAWKHIAPDTPSELSHGGHRPHERLDAADAVQHFLSRLDEAKRQVFILSELEGMSAPEIAETLNLNVNTVYARIRAARLRFAKLTQGFGPPPEGS